MASKFCFLFALVFVCFLHSSSSTIVSHDGRAITINGVRRIIQSGSIHYPRSTPEMWPDLIRKAKEGGLDAVETYVFWNIHEPIRRQYDFTENRDLVRFIKTIQNEGLYAVLRIGPYVCAEWNYGGLPIWLHNMPGIEIRTANTVYMNEMQNFTTLIVDMLKEESLFASQGGPIIIAQIENEYGNVIGPYGYAGKAYLDWCANLAESQHVGVPWIMCQQSDAPQPMINTCNGFYCDQFKPSNPNTPKMWTENWTGWFKNWGGKDPYRTAEDVAFAVARFFQFGGTFQNYYMYHGGTNFGRTAGGPYITTSYDYNAPLDEYGNLNQPKWGHLKQLHQSLKSIEKILTYGNSSTTDLGNFVSVTNYTFNGATSCFFGNANSTNDAVVTTQGGRQLTVPAWSVSILPDCENEVYNTAKVNTQTSVMVQTPSKAEDEPASLTWSWKPEKLDQTIRLGKGHFSVNMLLDQKTAANDASDYLWYITNVHLDSNDPIWGDDMILHVNATGQVIHAYVNGRYIGSQWATYGVTQYSFDKKVKLNVGKNLIALLSVTVGYQNYGPKYDLIPNGIPGPVQLISSRGDEKVIKDLSSHKWTYKVGLHGLDKHLYDEKSSWQVEDLPTNRTMTWYKTTFKAPLGEAPVVVDLQGLGKGLAWVNGHSIGRYWPSFKAEEDGCSLDACDYRGSYYSNKCNYNCGQPTQRWYHVPRSWLNDDENTLVLFEEFGGNPSLVNFQTVVVGTACGHAYEGSTLELSCEGRPIKAIQFANFGNPQGTCGSFEKGNCEGSENAINVINNACVGKETCSLEVSEAIFGTANCDNTKKKRLAVQIIC
ncbi:Beta-galactosidase 7 [Ancistrocladus abbreviatus]